MAPKQILVGNIDLSLLDGVHINTTVNGEQSIVIPVKGNPAIFIGSKDKGGHSYMDIEVRETQDSKYGNTHFVKLSVGRKKREQLGIRPDDIKKITPIIGNLKPLEAITDDLPQE